ncbi:uncharacterized protein [Epargyreus clarus]|uniref:uncharacterized protein n=1 Tax=Epargyreus clarus TaxID=520877 RepID=UPI003C2F2267
MKDDDEQEENTFGVTRYACMPSLVALQQMRNRLHLAFLGRKLMKWTALATGRELRKIAIELDSVIKGLGEEMRNAFILLARARYFCPEMNKIVLENIGTESGVVVIPTTKAVSAVKIVQFEIAETGVPPYPHLGIEKGGQAVMEAKKAWLELLKKLIMMMQLRTSFITVETANKNATKKWNVLSKLVVPRVQLSMRYIMSELEEIEREDNFRLKRFKELKYKNKKGDDDTKKRCYCKKHPETGDDFVCFPCKQEEERKPKKSPCDVTTQPGIEVIGDKASSLCTVNQKRLDDLNAQLEKVISLTCQCKLDGLVSGSVDRLIYACEEIRCKLDTDQKQTAADETPQSCCTPCETEVTGKENGKVSQKTSCETYKEPEAKEENEEDSLGYFETKYKETVKVMKFKNDDGTVSEERQVVTVKTEKKHPHKPNEFGISPCCKIKQITSMTSNESKSDGENRPKVTKSEEIPCMKTVTKTRSCVSDSGSKDKRKKETKESSIFKCNKVRDAATETEPPTLVCPKSCSFGNISNKSKVSTKSSKKSNKSLKKKSSKKDASCACKTEIKTVCCDAMWKDVATSTTDLAASFEETEEQCICIKESEANEPEKNRSKVSIGHKSANSIKVCCDKASNEAAKKKSSVTCSICSQASQSMKDTSTTTSNIGLEANSIRDKPRDIKVHSCLSPPPEMKKSSSKIDKRPKPCCKATKTDEKPKTCCKIRIISNQGGKAGNVQELIFFGNILDAIKKILVPDKSDECLIKTRDTKTSKNANSLSKKSSFKSSVCKSCESKVPSKGVERSQSCPFCSGKNVEKSISWSRPRSQSADRAKEIKPCSCTPRADISKCSVCGSELSKAMKSDTTSADITDDDVVSCEIESCVLSRTATSATSFNDQEEPCVCRSTKKPIEPTPKCKVCYPEEDLCTCQKQESKKIKATESKCKVCSRKKSECECLPKDAKNKQMEPPKCTCNPNEEPPKKAKAKESRCEICNREKTECECNLNDAKNKMESPEPKCKVCYPEEDPNNQNQEPSQDVETSVIKCKVCNPDNDTPKETSKGKCKTCFSDNQLSKASQTETLRRKQDKKPDSASGCPLCPNEDQKSMGQTKKSTCCVPETKSKLCCDSTRVKDETDCKKCVGVVMKDASTSTRRSDRYDVRPLKLMKPDLNMTCTCHSDSYLSKRSRPPPNRCSSCHADYYK